MSEVEAAADEAHDLDAADIGGSDDSVAAQPVTIGLTPRFEGRVVTVTDPISISVDGRSVEAQNGELLIDACERAGAYVPRFCYHPRMSTVGMCRMCLVEVEGPRGSSLQPSCMVPVAPDMVVRTQAENVAKAQDGVLEFLLANHPLDCPVCDKGGECPLQDQTMAYGPGESRFVEEKRHYEKPISISETVYLDRERCILCDRCTRFADEVAGDPLIHFIDRGSNTQVLTFPDEPFASYFSGNVVQICPVGALTAKPYRFKARPWDLATAESTCTTCSVGCRVSVDTSRDRVLRVNGVDVDAVNQGWLCDRGRFSFEATNSDDRIDRPLLRRGDELADASWSEALRRATEHLQGASRVAVIGGSALTNEGVFAFGELLSGPLAGALVEPDPGDGLPNAIWDLADATIDDMCRPGGTVIWVGPDPKETLPIVFLRLRDAVVRHGVNLIHLSVPGGSSLSSLAGVEVSIPLGELERQLTEGADTALADALDLAATAENLTIVIGRRSATEGGTILEAAAAALAGRFANARFLAAHGSPNARGARAFGLERRGGMGAIVDGLRAGEVDAILVLDADPLRTVLGAPDLAELMGAVPVVSLAWLPHASAAVADVVLPMAPWSEVDATTTNLEGRVLSLTQRVTPVGTAMADWEIALELGDRLGTRNGWEIAEDVFAAMRERFEELDGITWAGLRRGQGRDGALLHRTSTPIEAPAASVLPKVDQFSLRLIAVPALYDGAASLAACASSVVLADPASARLNPADIAKLLDTAEGDAVTVVSQAGETDLVVVADERVPVGHLKTVLGAPGSGIHHVIDPNEPLGTVRIQAGGR